MVSAATTCLIHDTVAHVLQQLSPFRVNTVCEHAKRHNLPWGARGSTDQIPMLTCCENDDRKSTSPVAADRVATGWRRSCRIADHGCRYLGKAVAGWPDR